MSNWYLQNGKESDVVISTRIRLARNIKDFRFPNKYSKEESKKILEKIEEITPSLGYGLKFIKLENLDDITKISLIEKHLLSPEFAMSKKENQAMLINEEENICVMINEEDHIRMQVFAAGFDLENLLNLSIELDQKLENLINYAYSEKYGYLTSCLTNIGTGMRASVMVHLPALTITGNIGKVLQAANNFGMNIRGIYGEGSQSQGNVYQIFNNQSLGITEQEIIKNVKAITEKIIEQERLARKYLGKKALDLENRVYRSYGILAYSSKLSSEECRKLLSDVKLGTDLGIIKELDDLKVNKLQLYTKPGNLQKYFSKQLNTKERDIKRAEIVKKIIKEENV